jgi:UDP-N-acetylmuramoyl-tripeptide--D-alanyl-D-alanine ligase
VTLSDEKGFRGTCAVKIYGSHNWNNLLSAIAIGAYLQVSTEDILTGLSLYESKINRSQVVFKDTNIFYLDAYNANPTSVKMALDFLSDLEVPKKIAILGDMMELGLQSLVLHQEIATLAIHAESLDQIFFVGTNFAEAIKGQYNMPDRIKLFKDAWAVSEYLKNSDHLNTHFLVKGSRSMKLETILH